MGADVAVIGGGPAGMMAAITAAGQGSRVLLFEKNDRLGRKLAITGKGRCNVTNDSDLQELLANIPRNAKFLYSAFSRLSSRDTMDFFESRGVPLKVERGKRVFPVSDRAGDIVAALGNACRDAGVQIIRAEVTALLTEEGVITGVRAGGKVYSASKVIVATGGLSYPATGSTGDGYRFAQDVGHKVIPAKPSLVALTSDDPHCSDLMGLSLRNVTATLYHKQTGKACYSELGELLFTHFGLSGPLILSASAHIKGDDPAGYEIGIDLKPGLTEQALDSRLLRDFAEVQNKAFCNALDRLLPRKLIPIVVMRSGIPPLLQVNSITKEQRRRLVELLKGMRFSVSGFRPIDEAIITAGGVSVTEVNPKTMESKLQPGLYFAGEVLDVDGYTGGFNLQIAFSTGYLAGLSAGSY